MFTIAISNQKGGVGKTTTAIGIAGALVEAGRRVLAIDLDPQANLTLGLGFEPDEERAGSYELLLGEAPLEAASRPTALEGLSLVPARLTLAGAERRLLGEIGFDELLRRRLASASDLDVVVIDCPPSLGLLATNGITAADLVLVPVQCEFFSLRGLGQLTEVVELVRERRRPALQLRVVPTLYDRRNRICRDVLAELRAGLGETLLETVVGIDTQLREAQAAGVPVTRFAPRSRAANAYRQLAAELLRLRERSRGRRSQRPHAPAHRATRAWT